MVRLNFFSIQSKRGPMIGLLAAFWSVGNILTCVSAWVVLPRVEMGIQSSYIWIGNWRIFVAIGSIPSISSAIFMFFMPESPMFLTKKGRFEDATKVQLNFLKRHPQSITDIIILGYSGFFMRSINNNNFSTSRKIHKNSSIQVFLSILHKNSGSHAPMPEEMVIFLDYYKTHADLGLDKETDADMSLCGSFAEVFRTLGKVVKSVLLRNFDRLWGKLWNSVFFK